MNQFKGNIEDEIKSWMDNEMNAEKLDSFKAQVNVASTDTLDQLINPMWQSYEDDVINERSKHLTQQSQQKEKLLKLNTRFRRLQIAAALIPAILIIGFIAAYFGTQPQTNYFELQAMKGEKSYLDLPDQSKVWINSESCLKYTSNFSIKERHLYLKGEGFFEVAHQNGIPFTVSVGKINVVVKGTKFNVKSDSKEIEVALLEGKVDIFYNEDKLLASLLPNQIINIDAQNPSRFSIKEENTEQYGVWTQNKLLIQNENLFDISKKIEKWYGVDIHLSNVDPTLKYTFTIKTESLNETLSLMNQLMSINYSINGEEVMIKKK